MRYEVKKNLHNDFKYIRRQTRAPSRYKYAAGCGIVAGKPVLAEARLIDGQIWVTIFRVFHGTPTGGGQLLKIFPASDVKQGEWDRIYNVALTAF